MIMELGFSIYNLEIGDIYLLQKFFYCTDYYFVYSFTDFLLAEPGLSSTELF